MICLTGDIHHASLRTGNQQHADRSEILIARAFLDLLEQANVPVTFFISGKCFVEEWSDLESICRHRLVEVGGHNFSCFQPEIVHRFWNKTVGSYNGPAWLQRRDARKTIDVIRARTGRTIRCWRNHMYMHGPHTETVLGDCGIELCSDGVCRATRGPVYDARGVYNFPINVIPDHEHIYHAERTPEWVDRWVQRYAWSDDFGSDSYAVEQWADLVLEGLERNEADGAISNMIIHPITMYLADGFRSFERILNYLADRECVHTGDLIPRRAQEVN
jgi:hypothetical protein